MILAPWGFSHVFEGVKLYEDSCRSVLRDFLNQDSTSDQGLGAIPSSSQGLGLLMLRRHLAWDLGFRALGLGGTFGLGFLVRDVELRVYVYGLHPVFNNQCIGGLLAWKLQS